MTDARRIVVIGAGHNGLAAAAYLARARREVVVLEAAEHVGGAAVTRDLAPGFRVPVLAHLAHLLDPVVVRELGLARHGLAMLGGALRTVALGGDEALVIDGHRLAGGGASPSDATAYATFAERMRRFAAVLGRQHGRVPPRLRFATWREALPAALFGLDIRRLGRDDMREFLRVITMPIHDVLEESVESPRLKGAIALDAVLGTRLGPRSGNTVFTYLHRLSRGGAPMLPRGGVGGISDALAAAARIAGAEIRLASPVAAIEVAAGRVTGVTLANGEHVAADAVVSSVDPKATLLCLLGARHLEAEFGRRVHHLRTTGTAAKLNLALSALPTFRGVPTEQLGERLVIAPDATAVDEAFNAAKYGEYSPQPVIELIMPSVRDATLAPPGKHVLSAIVQYAPYDIAGGWDAHRDALRGVVLDMLERHAPGLGSLVVAAELLTPTDIERRFRISGGHWHHAEMMIDQALMLRPVPGAAQYAAPVAGLFLCGAGCHPGGGVMGTAGRNAARVVLGEAGS